MIIIFTSAGMKKFVLPGRFMAAHPHIRLMRSFDKKSYS
jgi:hypothetical protein